ncbi:interleukin-6 receptor subunit beta-like [Pelobates fuscus]|uniref:interleukin-6 receptor subunit beta-like n=1 Tax=Pelobates fuscus TaxID=191477 RepID=UPI002FE45E9D
MLDNNVTGFSSCHADLKNNVKTCTELCLISLDQEFAHYIQIRQKYAKGLWSDWSDFIFVPAAIGHSPETNYTVEKLSNGTRKIVLHWQKAVKEQGDVRYNVSLTFLPCRGKEKITHQNIGDNQLTTNISGAAYNLTVVAFNSVENSSSWSSIIEEDGIGMPVQNVRLVRSNELKLEWSQKTASRARYCIEWKSVSSKGTSPMCLPLIHEGREATIITDFQPMQCYRITVYQIHKQQRTIGMAYYLKPSMNKGPSNLTVIMLTADSVLLKWEGFNLCQCQGLLKTWVVITTKHGNNISKEFNTNSSVNHFHVKNLTLGTHYTFRVKGITSYDEHTGSTQTSFVIPNTASNIDIPGIVYGIIIAVGLCCFVIRRLKKSVWPALPDPKDSNATKFVLTKMKHMPHHIPLIDTNLEYKEAEVLTVESNIDDKPSAVVNRNNGIMLSTVKEDQTEKDLMSTLWGKSSI